jgi:hypothetical protein
VKIISFDPGSRNFAYAVLTIEPPNILLVGHLNNPIVSLKENDLKNNVAFYLWEIKGLLDKIEYLEGQDKIIIERYQSRGNYRNTQLEATNIMIGVLLGQLYDILLVMPATWKSFIKRRYTQNNMLKLLQNTQLTPHMADAIGMAIFYIEKYYKKERILNILKENHYEGI